MSVADTTRSPSVGINPAVLRWARDWRGRSAEAAAKKVHKKASDILGWEMGVGSPTVHQARALADFYERPFLELFLDTPPDVPVAELVPDYRLHAKVQLEDTHRDLQFLQQWAVTKRSEALGLCEDLGIEIPNIPLELFVDASSDPEAAATQTRVAMAFPI